MSVYLVPKRPLTVTLTFWGVILFSLWNVSKAVVLLQDSALLLARAIQPDPRLQAVVALVWALLFGGAAWGLWQARPFARQGIPLLSLAFGLYTLGIRLIFSPLPFWSSGGSLDTLFFLMVVILSFLALKRAGHRHYFVERGGLEISD